MADGTLTKSAGITAEGWLTDSWYFACVSKSLEPGHHFRRIILGQPVLLARTAKGEVFALRDVCPHRLVPLSAGQQLDTNGEPTIQCPTTRNIMDDTATPMDIFVSPMRWSVVVTSTSRHSARRWVSRGFHIGSIAWDSDERPAWAFRKPRA